MPAVINKQPLFAGTIRMVTYTFDPPIMVSHYDMNNSWSTAPTTVYTAVGDYGDIIDRLTISATGDTTNTTVTAKLVYVYLYDSGGGRYSLYKTLAMPAATISDTVPNPELELVFQGGLLLKLNDQILIGASVNSGSGDKGDWLSVTIEGGTYNAQ